MRTVASVTIDRSMEEVFKLATDDVSKWSLIVVEDELLYSKNDGGVGSTFHTVTEENGRRMEFHGTITAYDPPFHHAVHMVGSMFDIDAEYRFEDVAGKTKLTQESSVQGKGLMRIVLPIMGFIMRKKSCEALQKELDSLKAFCETHEAVEVS